MIQKTSVKYPPIKSSFIDKGDNSYSIIVEPLLSGYGHTLGNSLRRVLLSSVPGFAVTRIRINDITHEYQSVEGILEDAMNIVLNLKLLRTKILTDDDSVVIALNKDKGGDVKASDFDTEKKVEIVNPDLYICHLSKDIKLNIEVEITRGVGYLPADKIDFAGNLDPQDLLVDALFSPVTSVALNVEKVRVGDRTDYDKMEIHFTTDGSQKGEEITSFVFDFINDLYSQIQSGIGLTPLDKPKAKSEDDKTTKFEIDLDEKIVEILDKNGIETNSELLAKASEIEEFAGMTKKNIKIVQEYIKSLN